MRNREGIAPMYKPSARLKDRWTTVANELTEFFKTLELPEKPEAIQLSKAERVLDVRKMIASDLATIHLQNGNIRFTASVTRLQKVMTFFKDQQQRKESILETITLKEAA